MSSSTRTLATVISSSKIVLKNYKNKKWGPYMIPNEKCLRLDTMFVFIKLYLEINMNLTVLHIFRGGAS